MQKINQLCTEGKFREAIDALQREVPPNSRLNCLNDIGESLADKGRVVALGPHRLSDLKDLDSLLEQVIVRMVRARAFQRAMRLAERRQNLEIIEAISESVRGNLEELYAHSVVWEFPEEPHRNGHITPTVLQEGNALDLKQNSG
jgi:hypothetical protein